jgi:hypothetical protein
MDTDEIVRLATASNPQEAHIWRQALEREGIRAQVVGDYLDAGVGDVPGLRAEVWVRHQDLERARSVLEAHQHGAEEPTEADEA